MNYTPAWKAAMALCCVAAVVAIVMQPAHADDWTGKDKAQHAQAGALIGGIAAAASQSPTVGCLMAVGAGIAKEAYDSQHPGHTASYDSDDPWEHFRTDMSKCGYVRVGNVDVTFDVPDNFDPREPQIAMLEQKKEQLTNEFHAEVTRIETEISKLKAIEYTGA